ncbi:hypothetical protein CNC06700 [Cryptococcus deneoformans JEC21]|uniref:Zn(2)-C6 fungal-type domain-containing protein n=1 Tax=Cryptococcus deneoformans (strain JEC21 / ATCC MYA-565) TaxID=214684 RepID=Q5KJF7_CRYD1|nr:hypothetical protein CNC06700 [Cryptococcus neoformans var. neoformans JEC21]AAW42613.2 hypothetical protein CNC06700 [Cryptococcus neoformans var. neoformans JEC21]
MSNSTEDLSSFFFSTVTVAPDSTAAPSDVFFVPAQVQNTEFNIQPWSISSTNEALATEPQTEFNLGLHAQVGDGFGFNTYSINLLGNENDVDSAGQVAAQPYILSTQSTCSNFGQDTNAIPDSNVNAFATPLVNQTNINTAGQVDIQQLFQIGQSVGLQGEYLWNFICSSFQNAQSVIPVEQIVSEQVDCQLPANDGNINTNEPQELVCQENMDEFIGWDFNISLADATVPSVVPATPAPQTHLTVPSSPVISKTPKTPSKPRKKSSSPQACKTPSKTHFKTLAKKGSIKDEFLLSTGPKVRLAISCHGCREARKPCDSVYQFKCQRCVKHHFCCSWPETGRGIKLGKKQRDDFIQFILTRGEKLGQQDDTTMTVDPVNGRPNTSCSRVMDTSVLGYHRQETKSRTDEIQVL